jgi:hypothetical protein|tara:strand:- start:1106 stop:1921 length:816 start_codon:yes stop_codon:yes gene_type:complete
MKITRSQLRKLIREELLRETEWSLPDLTPEMLAAVGAPVPSWEGVPVKRTEYFEAVQEGELNKLVIEFENMTYEGPYEMAWDPELENIEAGENPDLDATLDILNMLASGEKDHLTEQEMDQLQNSPAVSSPMGSLADYLQAEEMRQEQSRTSAALAPEIERASEESDLGEQAERFVVEGQVIVTFTGTEDVDLERTRLTILDTEKNKKIHVSGSELPIQLSQNVEIIDVEGWAPEWTPRRTPDEPRNPIPSNVVARDNTGREFRLPMKRTS